MNDREINNWMICIEGKKIKNIIYNEFISYLALVFNGSMHQRTKLYVFQWIHICLSGLCNHITFRKILGDLACNIWVNLWAQISSQGALPYVVLKFNNVILFGLKTTNNLENASQKIGYNVSIRYGKILYPLFWLAF